MANDLESEIQGGLEEHGKWQSHDFVTAQVLLWCAIGATVFGGLIAGGVIELPYKWLSALIASIPGAVLMVDRTFKYAARSAWHAIYSVRLRDLNRQLRDQGVPRGEVAKSLGVLDLEMEKLFPPLDPGLLKERAR